MPSLIKLRRDTAANWSSTNPLLSNGEPGYDTTNNKIKVGNGTALWNDLPYLETSATNIDWNDVTNKPTFFSGSYTDLTNKPSFATVATSGSYEDLTNTPTIPVDISDLTDTGNLLNGLPTGTRIVNPPATSQGANGDLAGDIAFDVNAVYFCKQDYTFVPPAIVTVVAVSGDTVWIDDADRPGLDSDFLSITGQWRLRNGETDYTIVSVTADVQYDGSYAIQLGTTPNPAFNAFSDYNLYQPTGVNIWLKSNWTSTGSW